MASAARSTAAACPRAPCTQDTKSVSTSTPCAHGGPKPCALGKNLLCLLHATRTACNTAADDDRPFIVLTDPKFSDLTKFRERAGQRSGRPARSRSIGTVRTCAALHTHASLRCMRSLFQQSRGAPLPPWLGWSHSKNRPGLDLIGTAVINTHTRRQEQKGV